MIRRRLFVKGIVQGVGFRPFVYKEALELSLVGFVRNNEEGVEIEIEGIKRHVDIFEESLFLKLPPLARIDAVDIKDIEILKKEKSFEILKSFDEQKKKTALVSADIATCKECLNDIKKEGRYSGYFATNCTNCGPRYSIIKSVPYDRKNTSMQKFKMCAECQKAYNDPLDRRYHAQPISCNCCGPKLSLLSLKEKTKTDNIFKTAANFIKEGKIFAIKGIGGFHIVCDAANDDVVKKLRVFKNRPVKPFAVMFRDILHVKDIADVGKKEEELLSSKEAPIVILKKNIKCDTLLSANIAPNIDRIGCFLPYTSLHYLLFEHLQHPIVATSANLADEPIITKKEEIFKKLPFIDLVLDFDREIVNGVDDSLLQVVNGKSQMLRLSRGYAPKVIRLPFKADKKILAVGANQKNAIALVMDENIIISPHIGDLDSLEAFGYFERTLETFKRFYGFEPEIIVHDKHPGYETTKWAKKQNKKSVQVQHHLSHIYACKAEFGLSGDYLGFSFDGTGYGDDGMLWGGEVFIGDNRKYSFRPIKLLGGEKALREPRRVALGMLFNKLGLDEVLKLDMEVVKAFSKEEIKMLYQSYIKDINTPKSSSVGRLFDAAVSFSDIAQRISYEGESGLLCESFYDRSIEDSFEYVITEGIIDINMVDFVLNDSVDKSVLCSMFINTLANIIIDISKKEKMEVILGGGVFQNKTMLELLTCMFEKEGIAYYFGQNVPINDAAIALGQAYYVLEKNIV